MAATRLDLRKRVLANLNDLVNETTATGERYPSNIINLALDNVVRHYANHLNSYYQGYLQGSFVINALANTSSYALPSTFRSPIFSIRRVIQNNSIPLMPFQPLLFPLSLEAVSNDVWVPRYYLEGNYIKFTSAPISAEANAMTVTHTLKVTPFATDASTLDDQLYDAEDCIVLRTTTRMLKGKDVSGAMKSSSGWNDELAEAERVFFMQVGNRYVVPDKPIPISDNYDAGFDYDF